MTDHAWRVAADVVSRTQRTGSVTPALRSRERSDSSLLEISTYPFASTDTALMQAWDALAEQNGASPYFRPGWVTAWWRAFGTDKLEIRTLKRNGKLAAILPIIRHHATFESVANCHSPRFGLLARDLDSATELALTLFAEKPRRVSISALDPLGRSMTACLRAAEETGYRTALFPYQRSPYLEIRESWDEYESRLSKKLLANLRHCKQNLEKQGAITMEMVSGSQWLDEYLAEAFSVEASGWKGDRHTAIQSNPETRKFYTDIAHWAAARNSLRIFFLRLDQRPIAMYYSLIEGGTCYLLKGGYDAAYSRYSPGKMLMHAVVSHCFSAGLSSIEFHGDANQYKFRWANAVHAQKRFEAYSLSPAGQLAWAARIYGRPAAKYVLRCLSFWKGDSRHEHNNWATREN